MDCVLSCWAWTSSRTAQQVGGSGLGALLDLLSRTAKTVLVLRGPGALQEQSDDAEFHEIRWRFGRGWRLRTPVAACDRDRIGPYLE